MVMEVSVEEVMMTEDRRPSSLMTNVSDDDFHSHHPEESPAASNASTSTTSNTTTPNSFKISTPSAGSSGKSSSRRASKLTEPKPFHFKSDERAQRQRSSSGSGEKVRNVNTALTTTTTPRNGTNGSTTTTTATSSTPRDRRGSKLTVPQAPRFRSEERIAARTASAEKEEDSKENFETPNTSSSKKERDDRRVGSGRGGSSTKAAKREFKPTVAQAPKFLSDQRAAARTTSPETEKKIVTTTTTTPDVSLAQSTDVLAKGLRSDSSSAQQQQKSSSNGKTQQRGIKLTVPVEPRFHQAHSRPLPKSTEERELEELERIRSHQFKALPMPSSSVVEAPPAKTGSTKKRETTKLTAPQPFHFKSDERAAAHTKPIEVPPDKEELDLEECKKKFKARPMPRFSESTKSVENDDKMTTKKKITELRPFHFATDERAEQQHSPDLPNKRPGEEADEGVAHSFRARALPKSTYVSPTFDRPKVSEPPPSTPPSQKETKPFSLQSPVRHDEYQKKLAEKRRQEELDAKRQQEFHARPYKRTSWPLWPTRRKEEENKPRVVSPSTDVKLKSIERHEAYEEQRQQKLIEEQEELDKLTNFKAKPLPRSTYQATIKVSSRIESQEEIRRRKREEEEERRKQTTFKARPLPESTFVLKPLTTKKPDVPHEEESSTGQDKKPGTSTNRGGKAMKKMAAPKLKSKSKTSLSQQTRRAAVSGNSVEPHQSYYPAWLVFTIACVVRVLNVFLIQSYFDPDEFWQTMEPAYCQVFNGTYECPGYTWEWKRRPPSSANNIVEQSMLGPARTYLSVLPTYLFYELLKKYDLASFWLVSRGPMFLNALIVAAPLDLAVWYAARWLRSRRKGSDDNMSLASWCLFCSLASWFNAFTLVRTFANSQEALFLVLGIALMGPELLIDIDGRFNFIRGCLAFFLGGLSVSLRFTSVAAFVPMGLILASRRQSVASKMGYLFVPCAVFGVLGIAAALMVDREFFGFWTLPFLGNFHFNVILNYAGLYGTHPATWYFSTDVPVLAGLLLPFLFVSLLQLVRNKLSYGERNLWIITLSYLVILSGNKHKEFRYIQPVLPLFCLLASPYLRALCTGSNSWISSRVRTRFFCSLFVLANMLVVLYLGLFHQTGPILVNRKIVASAQTVARSSSVDKFSIHYLTGACHSTPLHSQLHSPPLSFDTWTQDCSPDCRSDPDLECETELFSRDPAFFVEKTYFPCVGSSDVAAGEEEEGDQEDDETEKQGVPVQNNEKVEECLVDSSISPRPEPDYVVTFSGFVPDIQPALETMGLKEVARFPHHVNGAKIFDDKVIGDENFASVSTYRHFTLLDDVLEVSLEEMVLFSKHTTSTNG